jgi:predicted nucleic acid-binding Zn ribbon protein
MYHVLIFFEKHCIAKFCKGKSLPSNEEKNGKEMCDTFLNYHKKEKKKKIIQTNWLSVNDTEPKFPSFRNHTHLHVLIKLIIIPFEISPL